MTAIGLFRPHTGLCALLATLRHPSLREEKDSRAAAPPSERARVGEANRLDHDYGEDVT